jgi:hypothetical protein
MRNVNEQSNVAVGFVLVGLIYALFAAVINLLGLMM